MVPIGCEEMASRIAQLEETVARLVAAQPTPSGGDARDAARFRWYAAADYESRPMQMVKGGYRFRSASHPQYETLAEAIDAALNPAKENDNG